MTLVFQQNSVEQTVFDEIDTHCLLYYGGRFDTFFHFNSILYSFLTGKPMLVDIARIIFPFLLIHSKF